MTRWIDRPFTEAMSLSCLVSSVCQFRYKLTSWPCMGSTSRRNIMKLRGLFSREKETVWQIYRPSPHAYSSSTQQDDFETLFWMMFSICCNFGTFIISLYQYSPFSFWSAQVVCISWQVSRVVIGVVPLEADFAWIQPSPYVQFASPVIKRKVLHRCLIWLKLSNFYLK